jgi:hypothetical protein
MWKKLLVTGAAATAVAVPLGALPAYAKGPSLPPGCSYNSSTHQTTCTVATPTTYTGVSAGDMSSYPDFPSYTSVPASTVIVGGVTGAQICSWWVPGGNWTGGVFAARNLGVTVTTSTTTVTQGPSSHGRLVGQPVSQNTVTQVTNILGGQNLFCLASA